MNTDKTFFPNFFRLVPFSLLLIAGLLSAPIKAETQDGPPSCKPMAKFEKNSHGEWEFKGLTDEGLIALKEIRDALRSRFRMFDTNFLSLRGLHHMMTVARAVKGNAFIYGPPGGAKSACVQWFLDGEDTSPYKLQLHQMITEQAFVGGQNFDKAREGIVEFNTKGSLADYITAHVDEIEKGNPAVLAALLSLLNEREVAVGSHVVKAKLETLFATSNANLPEFLHQFLESGQGSTGPALLNRFQLKAFIYNWLSEDAQSLLDELRENRIFMKAVAKVNPDAERDLPSLKPMKLNWDLLRFFGHAIMKNNSVLTTASRDFIKKMRQETNHAVRESEIKHQQNRFEEPFVYFPSAQYTERLRGQLPDIIRMSAFVDFLLSNWADDDKIENAVSQPIELGPLSLWRAYLVLTTVSSGEAKLVKRDDGFDVQFNWEIDTENLLDDREIYQVKTVSDEQARFSKELRNHLYKIRDAIRTASQYGRENIKELGDQDLELSLLSQGE